MSRLLACWLAAMAALFAGCANYHLGTEGKLSFATIYVEAATSTVLVPQSREILTERIRTAFIRDSRVTLVNSPRDADVTLHVNLRDYRRDIAAVRRDDTGLARKFNVTIDVDCTLRDNRSRQALFLNRPITVSRDVFTDSGQLQAEYQIIPLLADALAEKVSHAVLDVW